jgi:hypothetical protein
MRSNMMSRVFILILLVFSLCACGESHVTEIKTQIHNPEQREEFIKLLREKDINFRIDDEGYIYYPAEQEETFTSLFEEYISSDLPAGNSVAFHQDFSKKLFTEEMNKRNIPYAIKKRHDQEWFVWDEKDSKEVNRIRKFVKDQTVKEIERRLSK